MEMRRWQSHKIVEAEPIKECSTHTIELWNGEKIEAPANFYGRGQPIVRDEATSDMLVRYTNIDGGTYLSWSPRAEFDDGYTELKYVSSTN